MFESKENLIVEKIQDFIKKEEPIPAIYIMLRNGRIINIDKYSDMVNSGRINPTDAYVYIKIDYTSIGPIFYYPFLGWHEDLLDAYFSKLGFYSRDSIVPATGLRYIASVAIDLYTRKYLAIELLNLDIVANNTNLRKIVFEVIGSKIISRESELTIEEYGTIFNTFSSQRLFAGYNVEEAWNIVLDYYGRGNKSLIKEVARIAMDYVDIFRPYRVCYDMKSWEEVDCRSIKL